MSADPLELAKQRSRLVHEQILKVVDDLTDDQIQWRPAPGAHSIAWTLWHVARCADKFAAEASPAGSPWRETWETDGLARRWGLEAAMLGTNGVGTGIDDDLAARLAAPDKRDLLDYSRRAFAAVEAMIVPIDAAELAREHMSFFAEGPATIGRALYSQITHDNRHLGEMEYIKGLLGLRGSATR